MGYLWPTTTQYVSCDWACHLDRTPPSGEAGTDVGCAYGSPVYAPESGVVTWYQRGPENPTGRHIQIDLDDGRTARALHLSPDVFVDLGDRVTRGQTIALSGASGNGSEWFYGPHLHQTLFPGTAWAAPTIDFELYVGPPDEPEPEPPQDEEVIMAVGGFAYKRAADNKTVRFVTDTTSGYWFEWSDSSIKNADVARAFGIDPTFANVSQGGRDAMYNAALLARTRAGTIS